MTDEVGARPLWAGRSMVLIGIILVAANLRTAVAAFSPIISSIRDDIPLGSLEIGVMGMLPPIAFAAAGFAAPAVARRLGLELTIALASLAMVVGPIVRALAGEYGVLATGTVIALAGMGFGNILLPPAVKKYFPDRIGTVTSAYATIMSIGAALPAIAAAPVADAAGWRTSMGLWGIVATTALIPWVVVWLQSRADARRSRSEGIVPDVPTEFLGRLGHSRVAWAIALAFAVSAFNVYAVFAWLPEILLDITGIDAVQAGVLLALFGIMGLPASLIVPAIAQRIRNAGHLVVAGVAAWVLGYLGLLLAPETLTWLWVMLVGIGPLAFPLSLALINLRTRSTGASAALSGFVQSVGYTAGALGPLIVAVVHDLTRGWTIPLVVLLLSSLISIVSAVILARPRFVEDDLAERAARPAR